MITLNNCFVEATYPSRNLKAWNHCTVSAVCVCASLIPSLFHGLTQLLYSRSLYEANASADLKSLYDVNPIAVNALVDGPQKDDLKATVLSYQANLVKHMGDGVKAIDLNNRVYWVRLLEKPQNS